MSSLVEQRHRFARPLDDTSKAVETQEVTAGGDSAARASDTIGAEKPDLAELAQQLAGLSPEDRQALAKMLSDSYLSWTALRSTVWVSHRRQVISWDSL